MSRIAVLGDFSSIMGFKALGFDVYPTDDIQSARERLQILAAAQTAILLITEDLAQHLKSDIQRYETSLAPAIILIPGQQGSLGLGLDQITELVKKAVGMDLFNERNEDGS